MTTAVDDLLALLDVALDDNVRWRRSHAGLFHARARSIPAPRRLDWRTHRARPDDEHPSGAVGARSANHVGGTVRALTHDGDLIPPTTRPEAELADDVA